MSIVTLCKITNENNEKGLCLYMNTYHMYTYTPPTHHHHTHTHLSGAGLTLSFSHRRTQAEGISWCRVVTVWGKVSDEGKVKHFFLLLLICFVLFFAPPEAYNLPSRFWNSYFHPLLFAEQVFLWGKSTKTSYSVTFLYLWRIHVDIWQNQFNIVKLKNKIKLKKKVM